MILYSVTIWWKVLIILISQYYVTDFIYICISTVCGLTGERIVIIIIINKKFVFFDLELSEECIDFTLKCFFSL